jgi:PLP dependent protein
MDATQLAANWMTVRRRVDEACRMAGRDPAEVAILPVSKTFGADTVRAALALGLHRFGENKVQEIRDKAAALVGEAVEWVVIGHLQTNKAKEVARLAHEVQSLDRLDLAQALHHRLQLEGRNLDVLVQVKTAREESKTGLPPEALPAFLEQLRAYPTLRVRGLMTLATLSEDAGEVRACFRRLRELRDRSVAEGHALPRLSMGMSGDFPLAIAEGATEVRIGTAIFGAR